MLSQLLALAATTSVVSASFLKGCAEAKWDSDTDFWQHKFIPQDSDAFVADYNKTYATIRNHAGWTVLHCTNEPPPLEAVRGDKDTLFVKVPVTSVGALDGFSQNLIDMLGMSKTIHRVGKYDTVTTACVRGSMYNNITYDQDNWDKAPEVNVTFYGDGHNKDPKKFLIFNSFYSPLGAASYLKVVSMFFGLEERAESIYDAIVANYRCAAANVQDRIMNNNWPQGALLSAVQKQGENYAVYQNDFWTTLANDAGVRLVNVSSDGKPTGEYEYPGVYTINAKDAPKSKLASESWAIIDTTQYLATDDLRLNSKEFPSPPDVTTYMQLSGVSSDIYAWNQKNIILTDKGTNRNLRHNFMDKGPARPDLVLYDLLTMINPSMTAGIYTTQFMRNIKNPGDTAYQLATIDSCTPEDNTLGALNITKCELPKWALGFHKSGASANAYGRQETIKSLALGGEAKASGLSKGAKAGISVGSIVGGLLIIGAILAAVLFARKRSANKAANGPDMEKAAAEKRSTTGSLSS
ncbi:uncharacterized protein K460DRAFT_408147 [Cucurbitaria berberidis CBS 394.84]|uniref:Periplasmic binding protein n=1 Tax=Cucurbitaria berberidis CBS 394.84 TaxID=1168544 RepID=A0A9P4GEC3_9PLEO|nr:uncharacterized protein K460DRAFT_408147 [Cucurbitaria berberidis CBS 394.84]KAF1843822.1 hypothetical protein K460DRAFT_408147 [Cucurbitaria berberidis CBS 394.84]